MRKPIQVEIENGVSTKLSCPFCKGGSVNLFNEVCPHVLVSYDVMAGGYVYVKEGFDRPLPDDYNEIPLNETDLAIEICDKSLGDLNFIILNRDGR